jgi:hypothetical protein
MAGNAAMAAMAGRRSSTARGLRRGLAWGGANFQGGGVGRLDVFGVSGRGTVVGCGLGCAWVGPWPEGSSGMWGHVVGLLATCWPKFCAVLPCVCWRLPPRGCPGWASAARSAARGWALLVA